MNNPHLPQGTVIITGATGGMGAACFRQMIEAGWQRFLLCDVSHEKLHALAEKHRADGISVDILAGDIADPAFPAQIIAALNNRPIAACIHTAGISPMMAEPQRILAVNLDATVGLVAAIQPHMAKGAAAVLISSNSSYFPMPPEAAAAFSAALPEGGALALAHFAPRSELAYPLSKLAVRALVKREAKAFGQRGARLVSLSPGAVDTPMTQTSETKVSEMAQRMIYDSASGRMGRADEIAAVALFLCSPAASFVTGVDWLVDGGHTAAMGF